MSKKFDGINNKSAAVIDIAGHYNLTLNKNHYVGPYCRILNCNKYNTDGKGYCQEHTSPLRSGLTPGLAGSAPVVIKSPKDAS